MQIQVSGKHVEVGDALKERIEQELSAGIAKYFERGGTAEVTLSKQGYMFKADCWVRLASGQTLVSTATGGDAHAAFTSTLDRIETRVRRYKRRLKNHHNPNPAKLELATTTVLRYEEGEDDPLEDYDNDLHSEGWDNHNPPQAMVIAETEAPLRTLTVSGAVLEMDMSSYPVIVFRNAAHGGLSVVYRRPDGNIGWIDPERTQAKAAAAVM